MVDGGLRTSRGPFSPFPVLDLLPARTVRMEGAAFTVDLEMVDGDADAVVWTMPDVRSGRLTDLSVASWSCSWDRCVTSLWHLLRHPRAQRVVAVVPALGNTDPGISAGRSADRSLVH